MQRDHEIGDVGHLAHHPGDQLVDAVRRISTDDEIYQQARLLLGLADDEEPEKALMAPQIVCGQPQLNGTLPDAPHDAIRHLGLQLASLQVEHPVVALAHVQAELQLAIEPTPERELHLVAVEELFRTSDHRMDRFPADTAPRQRVGDHSLLEQELLSVFQVLPAAPATDPKMGARRVLPRHAVLQELIHLADQPAAAFAAADERSDAISRHGAGKGHLFAVVPCEPVPLGRQAVNQQVDLSGLFHR